MYDNNEGVNGKTIAKWIGIAIVAILATITIFSSFYKIDPGFRGVKITLGKVDSQSFGNGVGFKAPFISQVVPVDVRTKTFSQQTSTYTSDIQTAEMDYTFTYELVPENVGKLYEKVGMDYETKKIVPVLNDALKDVIGKWQAQELVANRDKARDQILSSLRERMDKNYFQNLTFQFINIDYSDNFEKSIEDKVIAEQKAQKAINDTRRIQEEAEQKVISAKAEAQAMDIKAQALSRNKGLVEYEAVQKWDGKLPTTMMGNSIPFINLTAK